MDVCAYAVAQSLRENRTCCVPCAGRFREGRFKSQALLDEAAVLTAMAYVDLNPIRAGIAASPEESDFTSIQAQIRAWQAGDGRGANHPAESLGHTIGRLLNFSGADETETEPLLITLRNYLQLLDWSGRAVVAGKRGTIPEDLPPILERLGIHPDGYVRYIRREASGLQRVLGSLDRMRAHAAKLGVKFFKSQATA